MSKLTLNSKQEANLERIVMSNEFHRLTEDILAADDSVTYHVSEEGVLIVERITQVAAYAL